MTQDQSISNGVQALRREVAELRKEAREDSERGRKELAEFKLETATRLTTIEVGVGVMRWLFAALLAVMSVVITAGSVILGYVQGG